MSYPRKSSGLRQLEVNAIQYRWRFSPGESESNLVIYGPVSGKSALSVTLAEWRDPWLAFPEPVDNQPKVLAPEFIRLAIEFGLTSGWNPEERGGATNLRWQNGQFTVVA